MTRCNQVWPTLVFGIDLVERMPCASMAKKLSPYGGQTAYFASSRNVFWQKLYKSEKSVYFYESWQSSGNSMAVVNAIAAKPVAEVSRESAQTAEPKWQYNIVTKDGITQVSLPNSPRYSAG